MFYRHWEITSLVFLVLLLDDDVEVGCPVDHDEVAPRNVLQQVRRPWRVVANRSLTKIAEFRNRRFLFRITLQNRYQSYFLPSTFHCFTLSLIINLTRWWPTFFNRANIRIEKTRQAKKPNFLRFYLTIFCKII